MIYETERLEKQAQKEFYARMELYLNSKSIHEYIVEKDLKGLNAFRCWWADAFICWYLVKEKSALTAFSFLSIVVCCIILPVACWAIGLWWVWSLIIGVLLGLLSIAALAAVHTTAAWLADQRVPRAIGGDNDCFKYVDSHTSEKQMKNADE